MITPAGITALPAGQTLRDDVVKGLLVRAGQRKKAYYLWYRTLAGEARQPKVGDCAVMSLADARAAAKAMLLRVANGHDPSRERATVRAAPTLDDLRAEYAKLRGGKKKSAALDEYRYTRYIGPRFGKRKVTSLTYADAVEFMATLKDAPYQANRVLADLSILLTFAERPLQWRALGSNPCTGVQRYPEVARKRFAKAHEFARLGPILERESGAYPGEVAFLYLLCFSGARPAEIELAQRSQMDRVGDAGVLRLPDSKTGQREVFLPPQAMRLIDRLEPPADGSICGVTQAQARAVWQRARSEAGCPDLRMYPDLRRSFATQVVATGRPMSMAGQLLGHKTVQTTMIYARLVEDAAHDAAAGAAASISAMLGHGKADVGDRVGNEGAGHLPLPDGVVIPSGQQV